MTAEGGLELSPEDQARAARWARGRCPESVPAPDVELREVRHEDLSFRAPRPFEDRSLVTVIEQEYGGFRHSIIVSMEPTDLELDDYVAAQLEVMRASLENARIGEPRTRKGAQELERREVEIRLEREGKPAVKQLQAFFVVGGKAYTFTCSAEVGAFDEWCEKVFAPALESAAFASRVEAAPLAK